MVSNMKNNWLGSIWRFLLVCGPGLIVMEADNDAGAVSTYTQMGAQYGTKFLWVLLLLLPITYICQEMTVRLGIATGKGHASLIYQQFGKWWGRYSFGSLQVVNFLTIITEFAAVKFASEALGFNSSMAIGLFAACLIGLVITGSYFVWEKITIGLCLLDIVWLYLVSYSGIGVNEIAVNSVVPTMPVGGVTSSLVFLIIATIGTTVAPWQLFFQQSCVIDKNMTRNDLSHERLDTFLSSILTILVAGAMTCMGAVMFTHGLSYADPAQMAIALSPIIGYIPKQIILMMIINASILGAMAVTLSSSWAYSEVMEATSGLGKKITEAPMFYGLYIVAILAATGIVLIPNLPLQLVIISVQVFAGVLLPPALIFLQLMLNDKTLMPADMLNSGMANIINWTIISIMAILSIVLTVSAFFQ